MAYHMTTPVPADPAGEAARILVVEDNILLRFALAEWLRQLGYTVVEAVCADEAVMILGSPLLVDLVITDIEMPGVLNGYDLANHLKQIFPSLPVILVSGNDSWKKVKRDVAPYEFFQKPYNFDEIARRVAALLKQKKRGSE